MLRLLIIQLTALSALCLVACGGGGGSAVVRRAPVPPAPFAPKDVIAFGARAQDGGNALYLVQPDGADLRTLSPEAGTVSTPLWSPDGDRLAYVVAGPVAGANGALRLYDFARNSARTLSDQALFGEASALSWSPDGNAIAFIENVDGGRLRIYDVRRNTLLPDAGLPAIAVDWSPDSQRLALVRPEQTSLYTAQPGGSPQSFSINGNALLSDPRWAPDGTLALTSAPTAQLTGRTLSLYMSKGGYRELGPGLDPAWSVDGKLAFSRPSAAAPGAEFDIYVVPATGEAAEQMTVASTRNRWPAWSSAGDELTYVAQADASTSFLCTLDLATKGQSCLNLGALQPLQAAWSPF